jgi:ribose transport system ATP-binding protein
MTPTPTSPPPLLAVEGLRKSFFGVEVLKGVSFTLEGGHALGVIGENGSGKSTTMNIVNGLLAPSEGRMWVAGQDYAPASATDAAAAGIGFIHQELNLFDTMTVAENLAIRAFPRRIRWWPQIDKARMRREAEAALRQVGLDIAADTPVNRLPQGERQLVEIAKALRLAPRIVVFDEPTTSLTARECERLFTLVAALKRQGLGIIYISHILEDVLRLCDDVVTLRDGVMVGSRSAEALTVPRMVEDMLGRPLAELFPPRRPPPPGAVPLLEVQGLSQPGIVRNLDFAVGAGEIVGVAGLMGSGRSETARILFGLDEAEAGRVLVAGRVLPSRSPRAAMAAGMAFLTEDRRGDGLMMSEGILCNLELAALSDASEVDVAPVPARALAAKATETAAAVRIKARDLRTQPVRSLSGGNQQKVVLGKWLMREPRVFILDEPTRGIDVGAKAEIYALVRRLAERGAAVLMISSEFEELFGTCDRILVMAHGEIVAGFTGPDYDRDLVLAAANRAPAGSQAHA